MGSRATCPPSTRIPRREPAQGRHVSPDEIPDLVCCVFLKTRPLPPKTSAGEEKHCWLNYRFLKWCQIMPPFHGLDVCSSHGLLFRGAYMAKCGGCLGQSLLYTDRETEAQGGAGFRVSGIPRPLNSKPVFSSFLTGHK